MLEINPIDNAHRSRSNEVAGDHANGGIGHRGVWQALTKGGLNLETQLTRGLLRGIQRGAIRQANAMAKHRLQVLGLQLLINLRTKAMHHDDLHAHALN